MSCAGLSPPSATRPSSPCSDLSLLGLIALSTVLRALIFYFPFAIIVLFSHELRRALAAFGHTPFFALFRSESAGTDRSVHRTAGPHLLLPLRDHRPVLP